MEPKAPTALPQHEQQTTVPSIWAPIVNSLPPDKKLKVIVTVVEQFNRAVLEEAKRVTVTKIVLNLMEQNGR
jgi:hypothetical protein